MVSICSIDYNTTVHAHIWLGFVQEVCVHVLQNAVFISQERKSFHPYIPTNLDIVDKNHGNRNSEQLVFSNP